MLAATVRITRDLDLAEECVQDAFAKALTNWAGEGVPDKPGAWLTTVARNRALDLVRREATLRTKLPLLVEDDVALDERDGFPDDRLRLIFTCCHPALALEGQVALTLRLLCGLSTAEVARAFLVAEPTMAARITRAKKKISAARIPYRVPAPEELSARVDAVLVVLHLLFTTGHTAPGGDVLVRHDLVQRALDLTRMVRSMLPGSELDGLLALIVLTDARRATRVDGSGRLVLLEDQDRSRWDRAEIDEGQALLDRALRIGRAGPYQVQAAIAALHDTAPTASATDWREIAALYGRLAELAPSPVIELNRAVAIALAEGPAAGLRLLDALDGNERLATYAYFHAARADLLGRLGRRPEAASAYRRAIELTSNAVGRAFLTRRLAEMEPGRAQPN